MYQHFLDLPPNCGFPTQLTINFFLVRGVFLTHRSTKHLVISRYCPSIIWYSIKRRWMHSSCYIWITNQLILIFFLLLGCLFPTFYLSSPPKKVSSSMGLWYNKVLYWEILDPDLIVLCFLLFKETISRFDTIRFLSFHRKYFILCVMSQMLLL